MRLFLLLLMAPMSVVAAPGANELSGKEIAASRKVYVAKCAKCHRFYEPAKYPQRDWETWMDKMTQKAKLDGDQAELLRRYLNAYRAGELPGKPQDKPGAAPKVPAKR